MMLVEGKICIDVDDEELDKIVVSHCQAAVRVCNTIIDLESAMCDTANSIDERHVHIANIADQHDYIHALQKVIAYFGGYSKME